MEGTDGRRKWKILRQRLGVRAMGCCGGTWSPRISSMAMVEEEEEEEGSQSGAVAAGGNAAASNNNNNNYARNTGEHSSAPPTELLVGQRQVPTAASGMNLAMALAAERNSRAPNHVGSTADVKTLMKLIEETDGVDWKMRKRRDSNNSNNSNNNNGAVEEGRGGSSTTDNWVCCVCMERSKGAAFIPCGHTFCRLCSRELWVNRGSCPVCNRSIVEVLDIF